MGENVLTVSPSKITVSALAVKVKVLSEPEYKPEASAAKPTLTLCSCPAAVTVNCNESATMGITMLVPMTLPSYPAANGTLPTEDNASERSAEGTTAATMPSTGKSAILTESALTLTVTVVSASPALMVAPAYSPLTAVTERGLPLYPLLSSSSQATNAKLNRQHAIAINTPETFFSYIFILIF